MIRYLIDSSALWRIQRHQDLREAWSEVIASGTVGSCQPQRAEFRASARNRTEYDDMTGMFDELYPDVPVHKSAWRWVDSAQYRLSASGEHRGLSVVDLLVSATASHHGLTILHDDSDFTTVAHATAGVRERSVFAVPTAAADAD